MNDFTLPNGQKMTQAQRDAMYQPLTRHFAMSIRAVEGNERAVRLSFSSETPYERWYGLEILDHAGDAVNLMRLNELGCLLFNHNRDTVIGKILKAWVEDGRACANVEFDDDDASEIIRQKVLSGTLKGVSVGYMVTVWEDVGANAKSSDGRFTGPCMIAKRWEPLEVSIVSVPADATVGVGRDIKNFKEETAMDQENRTLEGGAGAMAEPAAPAATLTAIREAEIREEATRAENTRVTEITELCKSFGLEAAEYTKPGVTVDGARAAILGHLQKTKAPMDVKVTAQEDDKFKSAASDALLMRGGLKLEKPVEGAKDLRGMSLQGLLRQCLIFEGVRDVYQLSADDLFRQYFTPTGMFPAILDQTINKAYAQGYASAPATFERWTSEGSLSDFKPTKGYRAGDAGELLLVPEGGELKHDVPPDEALPSRKLGTYGRQFTMTREAFINDDIGYITSTPARYAASAVRTINRQVYSVLGTNPVIFDGVKLFDAQHKNLLAAAYPNPNSIQAAINAMMLQANAQGNALGIIVKFIIVPIGLRAPVIQALGSPQIIVGGVGVTNPLYGQGIEVVEDAELNKYAAGNVLPWFIAADNTTVGTIQVDYLNGQKIPRIRRMEYPGQLGLIWDVYLDWAISVMDYRGLSKNPGAAAPTT